jgi:hypothetical protein
MERGPTFSTDRSIRLVGFRVYPCSVGASLIRTKHVEVLAFANHRACSTRHEELAASLQQLKSKSRSVIG